MKQVIKASGEAEKFSPKKIYQSAIFAGASKNLANETVKAVKKNYHKNITTKEIFSIVLNHLKKEKGVAERYRLKHAIMNLGPSGFPFEQYFARILEEYNFKTKVDIRLKGKRIFHEIDILAEKGKKYIIECKYHNQPGIKTKIHPALYTYARFLDVKHHKISQAWLATNTKCSKDAKEYAKGVNMKITSWNYPKKESLRELIESKKLYPITILPLKEKLKQNLFDQKIVLAKDLLKFTPKKLSKKLQISEKQATTLLKNTQRVASIQNNLNAGNSKIL